MAKPPPPKTIYNDVFISYSRRNIEFARKIVDALYETGREHIWVDWEDIEYAEDWWEKIQAGIDSAENFVFILTPDSVRSEVCHDEVSYAVESGKRIVPLAHIPIVEKEDFERMHPSISAHNWLPFQEGSDFEMGMKLLLQTIETDLPHIRFHTRLQTRAREWDNGERNEAYLLSAGELVEAQAWLARADIQEKDPPATDLQHQYIDASQKAEDERQAEQARIARRVQNFQRAATVLGVVAAIALIATIASMFSINEANNKFATSTSVFGTQVANVADFGTQARDSQNQADVASTQRGEAQATLTQVPPTLNAIATQMQDGENTIYSLNLARRAEEIYPEDNILGLSLALQANQVINPPAAAQNILANLTYQAGPRLSMTGHTFAVYDVAFSPDGQMALSSAGDATLMLWDLNTGTAIRQFLGHRDAVTSVEIAPDGQTAFSSSCAARDESLLCTGGDFMVWDMASGTMIRQFEGHSDWVWDVSIAPDGKTALSASDDSTLILWDLNTGAEIRQFVGHSAYIRTVTFSPDGKTALSGACAEFDAENNCIKGEIILWDVETGEIIREFENAHSKRVMDISFAPDGQTAISASDDSTLILWDVESGESLRTFKGHVDSVWSVSFAPDGQTVLSSSPDTTLILWDVNTGEIIRRFDGHSTWIWNVTHSPDGKQALSAAQDGSLILWDVVNRDILHKILAHEDSANSIIFAPDGGSVISSACAEHDEENKCLASEMIQRDVVSGEIIQRFEGHSDVITGVAFAPDGQTIASAACAERDANDNCLGSEISFWDANSGDMTQTFEAQLDAITSISFSPDGSSILSSSLDKTLMLWHTSSGESIQIFEGHSDWILNADLAPDGQTILSSSCAERDAGGNCTLGEAILWDTNTGEVIQQFSAHSNWIFSVAFSPDGESALTGSFDNTMMLWDLEKAEVVRQFAGHLGAVESVAFSPNGQYALSGSRDNSLILWDITTGEAIRRFEGHQAPIRSVTFAPDGNTAASSAGNGTIILWEITGLPQFMTLEGLSEWAQDNRILRDLSCTERAYYQVLPLCDSER